MPITPRRAACAVPKEPVLFNKAPSCIVGPNDSVVIPRGSRKTDWEVELAVVIGEHASYVSESEAPTVIAGYCVCNDVSERSYQLEGTANGPRARAARRSARWGRGSSRRTRSAIPSPFPCGWM